MNSLVNSTSTIKVARGLEKFGHPIAPLITEFSHLDFVYSENRLGLSMTLNKIVIFSKYDTSVSHLTNMAMATFYV